MGDNGYSKVYDVSAIFWKITVPDQEKTNLRLSFGCFKPIAAV